MGGEEYQHLSHKGFSKACVSLFWVIRLSLSFSVPLLGRLPGRTEKKKGNEEHCKMWGCVWPKIYHLPFSRSVSKWEGKSWGNLLSEYCVVVYTEQEQTSTAVYILPRSKDAIPPPPFHALFTICRSHSVKSVQLLNTKMRCRSLPSVWFEFWVHWIWIFLFFLWKSHVLFSAWQRLQATERYQIWSTSHKDPLTQVVLSSAFNQLENTSAYLS